MTNTDSKSTSDNKQTQSHQTDQYIPPYPQQFDDTIDFYELWITLWDKKWLVIAMTAVSVLGSVVYLLRQPLIYKAEALLLPPKAKDIQSLNHLQELKGKQEVDVKLVFSAFKNNLKSRSLQKKFIEEQDLMDILAPNRTPDMRDIEILEGFSTMIKVENDGEGTRVSTESKDPEFAAKLVNDYIAFFDIETIRELTADARTLISGRIRDIEYSIGSKQQMERLRREDEIRDLENTISSKRGKAKKRREDEIKSLEEKINSERAMAKKRREDQIKIFEEAATIASKLGVKDRVDTASKLRNNQLNISTTNIPLYNRGYSALRAEIELLKNRTSDDPYINNLRDLQEKLAKLRSRKSDDPFIYGFRDLQVKIDQLRNLKTDYTFFQGLRGLQEELALLRSIKIDKEGQHAVTIDQPAYPPKYRIKPNSRLIVSIGTMAGLFFGIFLAFIVAYVQKQKKIHSA